MEVKNLAIFRHNICFVNVLKKDKNYVTKVYANLKIEMLSWKCLLTV